MNKLFTLFLFLVTGLNAMAQTGNLEGKVTSSNNNAVANVSIRIPEINKGTLSKTDGSFRISNIKAGSYLLKITSVGYTARNVSIQINAGETLELQNLLLSEANNNLDEVTVTGNNVNKFSRELSTTVSKMPLKDLENPQVYNSITNALLKEQVITNFDDALKNAPGIDKLWESTGRGGDGAGYFSLRGFSVQPTLVNGLPALTNGSPDIANIESIEVVKGPSGTLYGSSLISYGGLINVNTKRPFFGFGGNISYTAGTYGLNRISADVNTMLKSDSKVAFRINTAYTSQNSFQDAGFKKSLFVAPSLAIEANEKLSFFINTEFYQGKSTNQTMLFVDRGSPLRVHNIAELRYDPKRSYTGNDLFIETPTYSLQGQANYKINNQWTSQTVVSRSSAKSDGYYSYLYEGTSSIESLAGLTIPSGIILARSTSKQNSETIGTDIQQNFIGDFNIGKVRNRLLIGLDYFNRSVVDNGTGYGNQGFVNLGVDSTLFQTLIPALHSFYKTPKGISPNDTGVLTQSGADAGILLSLNPGASYSKSKQEVYSAYVSDVINFTPQLSVMASLRVDRFDNGTNSQVALSPKFGLVYQPILDKVSIFGNYMNGFTNKAPGEGKTLGAKTFTPLDPEHANQYEFGTKLSLLENKLSATVSYYNITVDKIALLIEQDVNNSYYVQNGKQTSKGFEASVLASPATGLNFILGYSYNDSKLVEGDASFKGFRPESAGPERLANLWASYKFSSYALNGFGLGFGGNYASDNKIYNRSNGTFTVPEYVVLNASAFYEANNYRFTLKLDNLTDKQYYKGWSTISPQAPRIFSANFTYNF